MEEIKLELTNGEKIPAIISNKELIYGVTGIAIGIKIITLNLLAR